MTKDALTFGRSGGRPAVLKVIKSEGDEWRSGAIIEAFGGRGVVRVYEYVDGAVLMERLIPGTPLSELAVNGRDEEATAILADVIASMAPLETSAPTVQDWGKSFATAGPQIPRHLADQANEIYFQMCGSQSKTRLLHGDLHHDNVLFDSKRGWLAIDPKGVIGELEYELGAALRNPYDRPDIFAQPQVIERRLRHFAAKLPIDEARALRWGFAQAVLSAIWGIEDGAATYSTALAEAMLPMIG